MSRKDYRNIMICLGIIFSWILILFFCIYQPYKNNVENLKKEIKEHELVMNDTKEFFEKQGEKEEYNRKLDTNLKILKGKIPETLSEYEFLERLNEIAETSNVQIVSLNPGEYKENKIEYEYSSKSWKVDLRGNYFDILQFLRHISLLPRLINITTGEIFEENDYMTCKITLQIYLAHYNK